MKPPLFPVDFKEVGYHFKFHKVEHPNCKLVAIHKSGGIKLLDVEQYEKFEAKAAKTVGAAKTRQGKTAKKAALKAKRSTKVGVRKTTKKIGTGRRKAKDKKADKPQAEKKSQGTTKKPEKKQWDLCRSVGKFMFCIRLTTRVLSCLE